MKILWLASWYPSEKSPFDGDFIQRHARAASLYNAIFVIHVTGKQPGQFYVDQKTRDSAHLNEHILFFTRSYSFFGRIMANYRLQKMYRRAIKEYIRENGKPDLVHVHVPLKAGMAALWAKRKFKTPFIVTEHWGIYNDIVADNYKKRSPIFKK